MENGIKKLDLVLRGLPGSLRFLMYKGVIYSADYSSFEDSEWTCTDNNPAMGGDPTFCKEKKMLSGEPKSYCLVLDKADRKVVLQVTNDKGEDLGHTEIRIGSWTLSAVQSAMSKFCAQNGLGKYPKAGLAKVWKQLFRP